ncbi:hypothetical protein PG997_000041 [Apiospora hydei]|uniref:Uncharacterized protein n=1 Tax=Apiospora hydei TaxID=1337664 RepID=A0ABR1X9P0_9PEZI
MSTIRSAAHSSQIPHFDIGKGEDADVEADVEAVVEARWDGANQTESRLLRPAPYRSLQRPEQPRHDDRYTLPVVHGLSKRLIEFKDLPDNRNSAVGGNGLGLVLWVTDEFLGNTLAQSSKQGIVEERIGAAGVFGSLEC